MARVRGDGDIPRDPDEGCGRDVSGSEGLFLSNEGEHLSYNSTIEVGSKSFIFVQGVPFDLPALSPDTQPGLMGRVEVKTG